MELLRKYLEEIASVNDKDWDFFSAKLIKVNVPKKKKLLNLGETENYLSFIEKGIVRLVIPNEDEEKETTFGFSFKNEFICAYDSFLTRTPSSYETETLTDTILWRISYKYLQDVYKNTTIGNLIGRFSSERLFLIKSKREQSLLNDTAEQRYLNLFTERPNLLKEVSLKYIASYIGVTPQALSRIRKRIS